MKLTDLKSSAVAALSATISSLCCLLPLVVVVLGLGSGAFMAVTMKYSYIFTPVGILGTGLGYVLYFRERRRCARLGCPMAGRRANLALLVTSTVVLVAAVILTALPDYTARLIASWGGQIAMEDSMNGPGGTTTHPAAGPAASGEGEAGMPVSVTLQVDGMTCGS